MRARPLRALWGLLWMPLLCAAQTTQALISGQVVDSQDGKPIAAAQVQYSGNLDAQRGSSHTDASGYYLLALLSPGTYTLRVSAPGYQPQQLHELQLAVAAYLEMNFRLRPLGDVWEQGQYRSVLPAGNRAVLTLYGPDLDTSRIATFVAPKGASGGLEPSLSEVIDSRQLQELPLAGRDAYTLLVALPGVASDAGTARGLGLSVAGQRPSASCFLLDGVENNNYLVSGPLTQVAPEALQEYRVSWNNFSAEYGRTSGFLANAVTRAGGNRWHGSLYYYGKNEVLDANGFQRNRQGFRRAPDKQAQPGFAAAGPLRVNSWFATWTLEYLRSRGMEEPVTLELPTASYADYTAPHSIARRLLDRFQAPFSATKGLTGEVTMSPPVSLNRWLSLARLDHHVRGGAHRLMGRVLLSRVERPGFIWTPYRDFTSPLRQTTVGVTLGAVASFRPRFTHEVRLSASDDDLHWDRAHPGIPTLATYRGTVLPGSPAFYAYRNRIRNWEFVDNLLWAEGRHIAKAGVGLLRRRLAGFLTAGRDGRYLFRDFLDFALDWPSDFQAAVSRASLPELYTPDYRRRYRNSQFYLFAQDSWKVGAGLVLNAGLRYENFGAPRNMAETADAEVRLGEGRTLAERLRSAQLAFPRTPHLLLYPADNNNFAVRFGLSHNLLGNTRTLLRGAYGIFYDRPFDNLWQNLRSNGFGLITARITGFPADYLEPVGALLPGYRRSAVLTDFPELTLYQPGLRDAYVQSYFAGVQHRLTDSLAIDVNAHGSLGRKLITTDKVNRPFSVAISPAEFQANPLGRFNPHLGTLSYRSNQGISSFHGLSLTARYSSSSTHFQVAYTWSHAIDNQSEPLAGDFFDLSFTRLTFGQERMGIAAFSRQFDSRADRGSSDFDQRHNLVTLLTCEVPRLFPNGKAARLLRNWRVSYLAALRSGFPFSVLAPSAEAAAGETIYNRRADALEAARTQSAVYAVPGGRKLLDSAQFRAPPASRQGNSGRNAFYGPGLFSIDLSLSRVLDLPRLGETARLHVRGDAFNLLNHANLNNPDPLLGSASFGVALFGRTGRASGFPALMPFRETARQIQLLLRLEF